MSQHPPWSEQDPGQFQPQPPGTPLREFARADDFMRHSGPNLGLREAPPTLLEIYDLADRVEALLGDFAHPATRDMRQDHVFRRLPQCRPRARGAARPGTAAGGGTGRAARRRRRGHSAAAGSRQDAALPGGRLRRAAGGKPDGKAA